MQIHSYIDGVLYQSESKFVKQNPYTLEKQHDVISCDLIGLITAIQSANKAHQLWKSSTLIERLDLISKLQTTLRFKQAEYARLEAQDQALPQSFVQKHSLELSIRNIPAYPVVT